MFKLITKFFLKYFWNLHIGKIKKNIRFKNIHKDQTCYIIGNGASLKYHDISKLPKRKTIATTFSLFDTRISKIKPNYYVILPHRHSTTVSLKTYPLYTSDKVPRALKSLNDLTLKWMK